MSKQIIRLCRLQLANLFGINEIRYTRDKKKRMRYIGLACVWMLLIVMIAGYAGALSYGMVRMGMAEIVPMYLYTISSILILVFSFFKAGSALFAMKGYEMMISLPVSRAAIIVSRFLCMYLTNFMMELLIMLPGVVVYAYYVRPSAAFYVICLLGSLFLPLLPLTISSVLGAIITAISSRSRHKSLVEPLLMIGLVVLVMGGSLFAADHESQFTEEMMRNMAQLISDQIGKVYPPAGWFSNALNGDLVSLLLMVAVPAVIFTLFVAVLQRYFQSICSSIHAVTAKNNYQMTSLQRSSHRKALWKKELKRYFSSGIYVTNTLVGYVLAVIFSAVLCFMGVEKLEAAIGIPNIGAVLFRCLPFGLTCVLTMTSITAVSISMEGNTFWQIQTLPVTAKEVFDSKILVNISVAAPFYLICIVLLNLSLNLTWAQRFFLIVIPVCYIVFSSVVGITINLKMPIFQWENEVRVVKQSASMLVAMLIGILGALLPLLSVAVAGEVWGGWFSALVIVILVLATSFLYHRNNRVELVKISER